MREFTSEIIGYLKAECGSDPIHFVGLGIYDFQLSFAGIERIQTMARADFKIAGQNYSWEEGPTDIPVWQLVSQEPISFELIAPTVLRMNLKFGDYVDWHTDLSPYEAVIIDFGLHDGKRVMEIY